MPRRAREIGRSNVYHVIFRGNDKQDIFYDDQDRNVFLNKIKETKKVFNYELYAYCLMDNHVHIVIKVNDEILSKSMHNLSLRYSIYFNKKFNRTGHVFQDRFLSKRVENRSYFLNVCKYVHRNPEKANMEKTEKYKWSSFLAYIYGNDDIVDRKLLMHYFNNSINEFKKFSLFNDDSENMLSMPEYEIIKKLSEDELIEIIKTKYNLKNASDVSLLEKTRRDNILKELKKLQGTSLRQLSRVTKVTYYYISKL